MPNSEIAALRAFFSAAPAVELSIPELRAMYDGLGSQYPVAGDVTVQPVTIGGRPAEWTSTPTASADNAILYFHGGGYVIGSLNSHRHLASELGRAAGARSLAVDYRLAPEAPFPAAVDDALEGYRFLLKQGIKPANIAIAGDSAGGGLTVATLLSIKAAGLAMPACGLCISPWVDLESVGASMTTKAEEDPMIRKETLLQWAKAYLDGASAKTALAAPIHGDLSGLPPLMIQVGSAEALLDDALTLANVAGSAGVHVQLEVWPEMVHVWHFFHPQLAAGREALADAGAFISKRLKAA